MAEQTSENPKILLVGDMADVFLDHACSQRLLCSNTDNITSAVELAAKENFAVIAIVMPGSNSKIAPALEKLRQTSSHSKIILLVQMYQEPLAMVLISPDHSGKPIADDYLICPVVTSDFDKWLGPAGAKRTKKVKAEIEEDNKIAERIRQLEKLATEDDLTGLKNRRYIWEFARQIIEHAKQQDGRVTLLIFDIDDFKHYNDQYGHLAGDEILTQASALMRRCCRRHDVVGRIGGDEFAVVFWDDPQSSKTQQAEERRSAAEHPKEAVFIIQRFRKQLEKSEFNLLGPAGKGILTISGGLASFPQDGQAIQELFKKADKALLEAKASGKNQIYLVGQPNRTFGDTYGT